MPISSLADRIASSTGTFEPQRVNNWRLDLTAPGGVGANDEVIRLSLLSFDPPSETIEPISIPYANEDRKVAGRVTRDNTSLTLRDFVDKNTYKVLREWQRKVYNYETGAIGTCNQYKGSARLVLLGPDLTDKKSIPIYGVWPSKVSLSTLDQSGSEQVQITVDLVYDTMGMPE